MSTHSLIAKAVGEGRCRAIYYFDGYPEGTGKTLLDHYASPEKVDALIGLGDISCLKEEVEADGEDKEHCTLAYARDYGEVLRPAREMTLEEFVSGDMGASYFYLFQNGRWLYSRKGEGLHFRDLREALHAVCVPEQEHEAAERKFGNYFVSTTPDCGIVREDAHHPHLIVYFKLENEGYLTKRGVQNLRSVFARDIFAQDLVSVYEKQTQHRDELRRESGKRVAKIVKCINEEGIGDPALAKSSCNLRSVFPKQKGRKYTATSKQTSRHWCVP